MKISTQAAKCLMGTGVSLLLLAAPVPLQGQPATAKTTSYTRYSEWNRQSTTVKYWSNLPVVLE